VNVWYLIRIQTVCQAGGEIFSSIDNDKSISHKSRLYGASLLSMHCCSIPVIFIFMS
jgi:hypothetical protein